MARGEQVRTVCVTLSTVVQSWRGQSLVFVRITFGGSSGGYNGILNVLVERSWKLDIFSKICCSLS